MKLIHWFKYSMQILNGTKTEISNGRNGTKTKFKNLVTLSKLRTGIKVGLKPDNVALCIITEKINTHF